MTWRKNRGSAPGGLLVAMSGLVAGVDTCELTPKRSWNPMLHALLPSRRTDLPTERTHTGMQRRFLVRRVEPRFRNSPEGLFAQPSSRLTRPPATQISLCNRKFALPSISRSQFSGTYPLTKTTTMLRGGGITSSSTTPRARTYTLAGLFLAIVPLVENVTVDDSRSIRASFARRKSISSMKSIELSASVMNSPT